MAFLAGSLCRQLWLRQATGLTANCVVVGWAEDSAGGGRSTSASGVCGISMHKRLVDWTTVPRL